jgi:hypothetical protein
VGHRAGVTSSAESKEGTGWPNSAHEARRFVLEWFPDAEAVESVSAEAAPYARSDEKPSVASAPLVEDSPFRAIRVASASETPSQSGFAAFLDGTQRIETVGHDRGIPIVWAKVSAAVRVRIERKIISWPAHKPIVNGALYVPFRYVRLSDSIRANHRVVDTANGASTDKFPSRHPAALMEAAVRRIQFDRERAEVELAELWCRTEDGVLYVDGSLTSSATCAISEKTVGVVKSHNRLYAEGDAFRVLAALKVGERTSIFRIESQKGTRFPVASWYVRVRKSAGHDLLFGLLRIEAAETEGMSERANEISRWVIAESSPLALPDGRWDKMAYGIRNTEEFLRAIS